MNLSFTKYAAKFFFAATLILFFSCESKEKHLFEYNLEKGSTFKQTATVESKLSQNMMGQEMLINNIVDMTMLLSVVDTNENSITLEMTYEEIKMNMDMSMGENSQQIILDSNTPNDMVTSEDVSPLLKSMVNVPFTVVMNKQGVVEKVENFHRLFDNMVTAVDPDMEENELEQMKETIRQSFSEEQIIETFSKGFYYGTSKAVAVGESWNLPIDLEFQEMSFTGTNKLTLDSLDNEFAYISFNGTLTIAEGKNTMAVNGITATLNLEGTQTGTFKVNLKTNIPTAYLMEQSISGNIEAMGIQIPQTIENKLIMTTE